MASFVHVYLYCYILSINNVMAVYNCTCKHHQSYRFLSLYQVSLLYTFQCLNVLPEVFIVFLFTRTALLTTMFTVRKAGVYHGSPRLVAVSVSYVPIYVPIVMYGLRMLIIVLQELAAMFTMMFTCSEEVGHDFS